MSDLKSFEDVLQDQIRDLHNAETQLVKALPKMTKKANHPALKEAIESHLEETKGHVIRLEKIAEKIGFSPGGKTCKAMKGLIQEGQEALECQGDEALCDAMIIAAAQRVEHYEIASYGTAREVAEQMELDEVSELLNQTLEEEEAADKKLTNICVEELYPRVGTTR
jgi:ferritin-like metal-binding protein YciE